MSSRNPLALIVVGATASGKTSLSLKLSTYFGTSIISADSRQCFKELTIGTAKPDQEELDLVQHYFINSHSIHQHVDAAVFEQYALEKVSLIFKQHPIAIITGGTGLYVKAFCEGMDDMPAIDPEIRKKINELYEEKGIAYLQEQLEQDDPMFMKMTSEFMNPNRLIRALEVKMQTGKSILDFRKGEQKNRSFQTIKIGIEWPRDLLYDRINSRVEVMMNDGLLYEVESLLPFKEKPALQTVGYQELFEHLEGKISLEQAVEKIQQHTRNYAKRQITWFKKDQEIRWFPYDHLDEVIPFVESLI
ncbi:MAG: tRNA (adenosine(37)-N6)-dimethylallyltransferase MiaA [Chitinophagaceae bacterium]